MQAVTYQGMKNVKVMQVPDPMIEKPMVLDKRWEADYNINVYIHTNESSRERPPS